MEYYLSEEEQKVYDDFVAVYDLIGTYHTDLEKKPVRLPLKMRECRFCGKGYKDACFKNEPHRFSNFLGNQFLIWDEECDDCNKKFSKYEKVMSEWLGLERVISDIRPGKKQFTFSSANGNVQSRRIGEVVLIEKMKDGGFMGSVADGKVEIDVTPLPYVPVFVYAGFLKNALSALPKAELPKYRAFFIALMNEQAGKAFSGFRRVEIVETNLETPSPVVTLYCRKAGIGGYPTHTVCLYVRNKLFQIPLLVDEENFKKNSESATILPAHFVSKEATFVEPFLINRRIVVLEGWEKVIPEKRVLKMEIAPEDMKNLACAQMPPGFLDEIRKMQG